LSHVSLGVLAAGLVGVSLVLLGLSGFRYIPNNRVGIVEKRFSLKGSVKEGLIALAGEAGFEPRVLRGGIHYLAPLAYRVHIQPLVTIAQGKIGYVFARDGRTLSPVQALASNDTARDFLDVAGFLASGGQRGPQRMILREGTYAMNLAEFVVVTDAAILYLPLGKEEETTFARMAHTIAERRGFEPIVIRGNEDTIGIVTVQDGPALGQGDLIAPVVGENAADARTYHNNFQDAEAFLAAGGRRGRQLQVLAEGTYYVNRLFATVEMIPKTIVEVGSVGVVVSYTGDQGKDVSGVDYKHGELVKNGTRGVWSEPLLPGKYGFNTYAGKVIMVPTTNFILKWKASESGSYGYDEHLTEVSLITKDAFEPQLPLSVVVHIDYKMAPYVIQRFGDVKRLVEQTLDPMVAAYFKNVGQTRTLIELLQDRSAIQSVASQEMKEKFSHYNLELEEVLIGTPASSKGDAQIETILMQLRSRQIAEEQIGTYARQEKAAVKERELREAEARAKAQQQLTESEVLITVESNQGKAAYQRSVQQAAQIRALAEAEAEKAARVGIGEAIAVEEKVRAYGGPRYQVTQQVMSRFAEAIEHAGVDVVPRVLVSGQNGGQSGLVETLLAMLMSDKLSADVPAPGATTPRSTDMAAFRDRVRDGLLSQLQNGKS